MELIQSGDWLGGLDDRTMFNRQLATSRCWQTNYGPVVRLIVRTVALLLQNSVIAAVGHLFVLTTFENEKEMVWQMEVKSWWVRHFKRFPHIASLNVAACTRKIEFANIDLLTIDFIVSGEKRSRVRSSTAKMCTKEQPQWCTRNFLINS